MIRVLKFKDSEEQRIWFSSDLHHNHNPNWTVPIWKIRGYESLEESNKHIVDKINNLVREDDSLFSVGDLCLNTTEEQFENLIGSLRCKNVFIIWGNHPNPLAKVYKREVDKFLGQIECNAHTNNYSHTDLEYEVYPFRYKNLVFLGHYAEIIVNGQYICLNHYPQSIWNYMKVGSWALTGHSHHGFKGSLPNNEEGKILDVGWDGYKKPLSFNEVKEIMDKKKIVKVDSHH